MAKVEYFHETELDKQFYKTYIKDRIPLKIIDMHVHITRPEYMINAQFDPDSWASQCISDMEAEDYYEYGKILYPDSDFTFNALPNVNQGVDIVGNSKYCAELKKKGSARFACMMVDPNWSDEYTEQMLVEGNFDGYKPYPDYISGHRGGDVSMFEFVRPGQYEILNRHKKAMVLHLPRVDRIADSENIREICEIRDKYPDIKLIIAHCGRSYAINTIKKAHEQMGDRIKDFYFDLAAVVNPKVITYMLENVPHNQIMYGTDLPVFLFHGRRRWTDDKYFNLAREDFQWNKHEEGREAEEKYTFFLYEQLKNILDCCDAFGGKPLAEKIFYQNAVDYIEG